LGVGRGVKKIIALKTCLAMKRILVLRTWAELWYDLSNGKMDIRFGTSNVMSLYRSGSLMTIARELARTTLDLVRVQEVRWDKGAGNYITIRLKSGNACYHSVQNRLSSSCLSKNIKMKV